MNTFMIYFYCKYYRAILLFVVASGMQSIYSIDYNINKSDIFKQDKFETEIFYEADLSYTDDTLDQAKTGKDTLGGKIRLVREINGIKVYQYVSSGDDKDIGDSILSASDRKTSVDDKDRNKKQVADDFKILPSSPYSRLNPIPANINLPDGLVFRIQLGAFSKQVSDDTFKGLYPVSYQIVNGKIKYYTGFFYSSESAGKALKDVREYGFSDSFLVSFYNGKIISVEKAREIEYSQIKL
jgi:hypothetical protein